MDTELPDKTLRDILLGLVQVDRNLCMAICQLNEYNKLLKDKIEYLETLCQDRHGK